LDCPESWSGKAVLVCSEVLSETSDLKRVRSSRLSSVHRWKSNHSLSGNREKYLERL
jgi:hypothetical protein